MNELQKKLKTRLSASDGIRQRQPQELTLTEPGDTHRSLELLKQKLLSFGGDTVVFPPIEEDLHEILSRGTFSHEKPLVRRGLPNRCHANICRLWKANQNRLIICLGYALSDQGEWHQHTWGLWNGRLVETTHRRIGYFGFNLNMQETELFIFNN